MWLMVPGTPGALELIPPGDQYDQSVRGDGKETRLAAKSSHGEGIYLTAFIQRVDFAPSAEKCRTEWWGTTKEPPQMHRSNVKLSGTPAMARVDYDVASFQGQTVDQHSVHAYLGGGKVCAEIHLSKIKYVANTDDPLFAAVLDTARLVPDAPVIANSLDSFQRGSRSFLEQDYKTAAKTYQQGLDVEKKQRTLNPSYFKVMVDNLGMAYGLSGDLANAKATYDYALTQYPEYPNFHYDMACAYAEMNNEAQALAELRLAYKYKNNILPGERMPDPMKDDSFAKYVTDPNFAKEVRAMKGTSIPASLQ